MCSKFFNIFSFLLLFSYSGTGQGFFEGSAILGINASQIDGDDLAGYNKLGIAAGLKISFPLKKNFDGNIEMLYSQRGSQSKLIPGQTTGLRSITLNYFEMPLFVTLNDWYIEKEDYHKVGVDLGISPAYLFDVASQDPIYQDSLGGFKKLDLSLLVGLYYAIGPHWAFNFRFTNGIVKVYKDPNNSINALRSYFLTFRSEYTF